MAYVSYTPNMVAAMGAVDPSGIGADAAVLPAPAPVPPGDAVIGESWKRNLFALIATASMAASAFHGYRRNESVGWALWWGFCGAVAPVITPVIAAAQGFGKPKRGALTPNRRRSRKKPRRKRRGPLAIRRSFDRQEMLGYAKAQARRSGKTRYVVKRADGAWYYSARKPTLSRYDFSVVSVSPRAR